MVLDATIIACGALVGPAVEASKTLSESNISARVINMASIKPIDAGSNYKSRYGNWCYRYS